MNGGNYHNYVLIGGPPLFTIIRWSDRVPSCGSVIFHNELVAWHLDCSESVAQRRPTLASRSTRLDTRVWSRGLVSVL